MSSSVGRRRVASSSRSTNNKQNDSRMDYAIDPALGVKDSDGDEESDSDDEKGFNEDDEDQADDSDASDDEDEFVEKVASERGSSEPAPASRKRVSKESKGKGKEAPPSSNVDNGFQDGREFSRIVNAIRTSTGDGAGGRLALDQMYDRTIAEELEGIDDPFDDGLTASGKPINQKKGRRAAADVEPSSEVKILMSIAMEHYHNDRMEQAREKFSEVIRIDPNLRQPWFTLATIHEARNEMDKALSFKIVGTHLSSLKSSARDWADLGSESRNLGLLQQAIYCFNQAIKGNKRDVDSMWDRAFLLKLSGMSKLATQAFLKILEIHPHDRGVLRELGPLLVDEGSGAKASELYMAAFDYYRANFSYTNQPDQDEEDTLFGVEDLLALVDYLSFQYRWAEMITSIRVGVRWIQGREMQRAWDSLDDDREYDMARKSRVAIPNGKSFEAAAVYPLDDRLRVKLGVARMGLNDMVEAKIHFDIVAETSLVENRELHEAIAAAYMNHKQYIPAIDIWDALAQEKETNNANVWNNMATCYYEIDEPDEAERLWREVISDDPTNLKARMSLAKMYEQLNKRKEAFEMVQEILREKQRLRAAGEELPPDLAAFNEKGKVARKPGTARPTLTKEERIQKKAARVATEAERSEEFSLAIQKLGLLNIRANDDGSSGKRAEWLAVATFLVDAFRETVQLFPADPKKKFTGLLTRSWKRKGAVDVDLETQADQMSQRLARSLGEQQEGLEVDSFRGLNFDGWLGLILKYAFLLTMNDEHDAAQETLIHVQGASVFKQNEQRTLALRLGRCACYAQVSDFINLTEVGRWISLRYGLQADATRIWLALIPGGGKAIEAINSTPLQKFNVRQMRAVSSQVGGEVKGPVKLSVKGKGKQKANVNNAEEEEEDDDGEVDEGASFNQFKPTKYNPLYMIIHGTMLLTSKSYQSAIVYFLRAHKFIPNQPLVVLCLAISYLHRSMQRQTDNRHHQISQSLAFFTMYRELKGEGQEVEYNLARAFHHIGLQSLAIQHYETVLELASADRLAASLARMELDAKGHADDIGEINDFAKLAAYNLSALYMYSGSPRLAKGVARRWLSI